MKFMVTWEMHPGALHETLERFAALSPEQDRELMGPNVSLIGRWHDLTRGRGVAIFEATDAAALMKYALAWNNYMELDIAPVLDDAEAAALGAG